MTVLTQTLPFVVELWPPSSVFHASILGFVLPKTETSMSVEKKNSRTACNLTNGLLCTCRESAVTHKCFGSENTDRAGAGQMELRSANSPFFSVGSGCGAARLQIRSVSGLLSYGVRLTPLPSPPGLPAMHRVEGSSPPCPALCPVLPGRSKVPAERGSHFVLPACP